MTKYCKFKFLFNNWKQFFSDSNNILLKHFKHSLIILNLIRLLCKKWNLNDVKSGNRLHYIEFYHPVKKMLKNSSFILSFFC